MLGTILLDSPPSRQRRRGRFVCAVLLLPPPHQIPPRLLVVGHRVQIREADPTRRRPLAAALGPPVIDGCGVHRDHVAATDT
ncbi:hypothetical protein MUK42_36412 [Musa troglodytarum]|uniref:Uncharacterized protein n=1 Tax=Musa troglodytarum TaxID=320322 RepID=A0A9E7EG02_9LILI|nr:hypothetical protein MUK42_36412 [Musa troglodytarum]